MKFRFILLVFLMTIHISAFSQTSEQDSLIQELAFSAQDTNKVRILNRLCILYQANRPDSALFYGHQGLILSKQINYPRGEVTNMRNMSLAHSILGNSAEALQLYLQALKIAEENNIIGQKARILLQLGILHNRVGNYDKALQFLEESKVLLDSLNSVNFWILAETYIAESYLYKNRLDLALLHIKSAHEKAKHSEWALVMYRSLLTYGKIYQLKGNLIVALAYFRQSLSFAKTRNTAFNGYMAMAQFFQQINENDSSIYYAKRSLEIAQNGGILSDIIESSLFLSELYQQSDSDLALQYSKMVIAYKDSLEHLRNSTAFDAIGNFDVQERQFELETAKTEYQNRIRINAFLGISFTLLVIAVLLFRNNKAKQKANRKIEEAYNQLKSTQSQLIQSEKMASLGELTAGIAHEIQNPLNFVNNFSEVNSELVEELREELDKGDLDEARIIATDIEENEQKIKHHGQRAESIVKGMLQHSRTNSGEKALTDINKLADEYLRLAYHGMRAKDKSFNAEFKTEFDPDLPMVSVVPQDIGRVLLNLINNAFYAVSKASAKESTVSSKAALSLSKGAREDGGYKPEVLVSTKLSPLPDRQAGSRGGQGEEYVEISVKDNGPGIPKDIQDKIFQPFFTTKPTGSGTGLGLSLSYDIVKAHGGELNVQGKEREGAIFVISIPFNADRL